MRGAMHHALRTAILREAEKAWVQNGVNELLGDLSGYPRLRRRYQNTPKTAGHARIITDLARDLARLGMGYGLHTSTPTHVRNLHSLMGRSLVLPIPIFRSRHAHPMCSNAWPSLRLRRKRWMETRRVSATPAPKHTLRVDFHRRLSGGPRPTFQTF